jgi:Recombinase
MPVIERIFRMAAMEGTSVHGIKRVLDAEGVPTPSGRKYWHWRAIHSFIMDDVYRPHPFDEVAELVTSEVAAGLDPSVCYVIRSEYKPPSCGLQDLRLRRRHTPIGAG